LLFERSRFLSGSTAIKSGERTLYLPLYQREISYQLVVSQRRKSVSLELKQTQIKVRCPHWLSQAEIDSFIVEKQRWLMEKLQQQERAKPQTVEQNQSVQDGYQLFLLGQTLTLRLLSGKRFNQQLDLENSTLTFVLPSSVKHQHQYLLKKLGDFYHQQAQSHITPRFEQLQKSTGLKAKALEFKIYKRRWGCCYGSKLIRINPMIMGAPDWVIDCVLIHELCHLQHMDHSAKFWQLNDKHCGRCVDSKQWLKQHGHEYQLPSNGS